MRLRLAKELCSSNTCYVVNHVPCEFSRDHGAVRQRGVACFGEIFIDLPVPFLYRFIYHQRLSVRIQFARRLLVRKIEPLPRFRVQYLAFVIVDGWSVETIHTANARDRESFDRRSPLKSRRSAGGGNTGCPRIPLAHRATTINPSLTALTLSCPRNLEIRFFESPPAEMLTI